MKRSRSRIAIDGATAVLFFVAVGLPAGGFLFRDPGPLDENRAPYSSPSLTREKYTWQAYPRHFEMYLGDRIGYRDELLDTRSRIVFRYLDEPVTDRAWIGRDGWYYINQSDPFRTSHTAPTIGVRAEAWVEALAERDAWFRAQGIEYIVLLAPDKAAVYPEHLRGYPVRHPPPEMATPVAEKLTARGVKCLNLLTPIRAEKAMHPESLYYFRTDSHWTPDGARAAYGAVAEAVRERFPEFRSHPDDDYSSGATPGGDLRRFAGIGDEAPRESARSYVPRTPIDCGTREDHFSPAQKGERLANSPSLFSVCPSAKGPNVLFLHDSFGAFLWPFLASDFRRASCIGTYGLPLEAVRIEKPSLVIQLMVARQLYSLTPKNPPEIRAAKR